MIVKPKVIVVNNGEDWGLEGIMTAKEVEARGLRGKVCILQEICRSGSVEVRADILAVIALAEHQVTKLK